MMKSIKTPLWDAIWIWNGLPIGLLLIALVWLQQGEVLYYLFALGIILETGHLMSSAVVAWSDGEFRRIMAADPFQYIVLPVGIAVLCIGIGAATAAGWTSYQGGFHSIYRVTDWRNPLPILVWSFWLSVGWHFSMQNFGIVRLYRSRWGSTGWRKVDKAACLLVTMAVMNLYPVMAVPTMMGLPFRPLFHSPWWLAPLGMGLFSWNHWLVAFGLGSAVSRRAGLFIASLLLFGLLGFFWKHPTPAQVLVFTAPLLFCTVIGLHSVHYIYDRAIFRFSNPQIRRTIGKGLFVLLTFVLCATNAYAQTPTVWTLTPVTQRGTLLTVLLNNGTTGSFTAPAALGTSAGTISTTCNNACSNIQLQLSQTAPCDATSGANNSSFTVSGNSLNVNQGTAVGTYAACIVASGSAYSNTVAGKFTITGLPPGSSGDGAVASAPNGSLQFGGNTWSFDPTAEKACGDFPRLVNGSAITGGGASAAYAIVNGVLYSYTICSPYTGWWYWSGSGTVWISSGTIPSEASITPKPVWMTFSGPNCTFVAPNIIPCSVPDTAALNSLIAGAHVIWNQPTNPSVSFSSSNTTDFKISGSNIVTGRTYTGGDDNHVFTTTITTSP